MITRGLRDYMARDWQGSRSRKDAYGGERIARLGPVEGLRIADELRRQMLLVDPGWPDAAQRQDDLRAHLRVAELLRRAGTACRP